MSSSVGGASPGEKGSPTAQMAGEYISTPGSSSGAHHVDIDMVRCHHAAGLVRIYGLLNSFFNQSSSEWCDGDVSLFLRHHVVVFEKSCRAADPPGGVHFAGQRINLPDGYRSDRPTSERGAVVLIRG